MQQTSSFSRRYVTLPYVLASPERFRSASVFATTTTTKARSYYCSCGERTAVRREHGAGRLDGRGQGRRCKLRRHGRLQAGQRILLLAGRYCSEHLSFFHPGCFFGGWFDCKNAESDGTPYPDKSSRTQLCRSRNTNRRARWGYEEPSLPLDKVASALYCTAVCTSPASTKLPCGMR